MDIPLLHELCETPAVPGREERVRALVQRRIRGLFDSVTTDPLGSLICTRKPRRTVRGRPATRVLIAAHMDEIGFYVRHIDAQGFLWLNPAGGFDPRNLFARRVLVVARGGDFVGVMNAGGKPIHISTDAERQRVPGTEEFFVDLGMDPKEVRKKVEIGDFVVMHEPFVELPEVVVSKALDNRMACFVAIEALRAVQSSRRGNAIEIVVAFTTQEEVGLRGAAVAANVARADIGIGLDVNLACDTPGVPETQRVTKQGDGTAVMVQDSSMISDHSLLQQFCALARRHRIPHQRAVLPRGGQDAAAVQRAARGARCIALGAGTRYIHTATETINKGDLQATIDLLSTWLLQA